jgi:TonB-linked SusC/RagA family outer membrane protein
MFNGKIMKKHHRKLSKIDSSSIWNDRRSLLTLLAMLIISCTSGVLAQNRITVTGTVVDPSKEPIIGATILLKSDPKVATTTDLDGRFSIQIPSGNQVLVFSFIGMEKMEIQMKGQRVLSVQMTDDNKVLDEVVVVGYGQQKKASVVGAITQTTGKVLERAGGISDIGAALTGNLPGVTTMASSGIPGEEEPQIVIRSTSSWNSTDPLVLVDGIERPMSTVDINSVESISVLKDASATAIFGVKGANGVILITTKRGKDGSAKIDVTINTTMKVPSRLPNKLDSYDALRARNVAIENELDINPDSWEYITPQDIIDKYRYPANTEEAERYPNVDWQKALFKDYTASYNANVNISGGTSFVKYFASADFVHEGDLFRLYDNGRKYKSGYGYNRLNVRSNLDFQLTKTSTFKVNLAGMSGAKKSPWGQTDTSEWAVSQQWAGAYNIAPDVFLPQYSDGSWGYYPLTANVSNSAAILALAGVQTTTTTRINTDFVLEQDLKFLTKGLTFRGSVSWDNVFLEYQRGVNDLYNNAQYKWIDPDTGVVTYKQDYDTNNLFDFMQSVLWTTSGGTVLNTSTQRNLNYQLQLNWGKDFGKHGLTAMGLFSREEKATGSVIPSYREDWAFRTTYNYAGKYFAEYNAAYNGSEKFSKDHRFAFFNSGALGWLVTEEKFMKRFKFLDMLKLRGSYGEIGDDNISKRWLYLTQWAYGGNSSLDTSQGTSPYTWYRESSVGNTDVHWETVRKLNIGADYSLFDGLLAGSVEVFHDNRFDILVGGSSRSVPSYFGTTAATANLGRVRSSGYELELRLNKVLGNGMRLWGNFNMTHAESKILEKDDPLLKPAYQKQAGYSIGQSTSYIDVGFISNYDQLYGSASHDSNDSGRLPGDYNIVDFNGDGVVDSDDSAPYGYASTPQNTYNATIGFEWKGFSTFVQFYGVNNVTRSVYLSSFGSKLDNVYDIGTWWSKENTSSADVTVPRWGSSVSYNDGTQYMYDGSYVRLKNAEVAYTFTKGWVKRFGVSNLKIYLNGNNLWLWTKMPDDRESNYAASSYTGAYPTMRRFNLGIKFTL